MCPVLIRIICGPEADRSAPVAAGLPGQHAPLPNGLGLSRLALQLALILVSGTYSEELLLVFSKHVDHQQE